MTLRQTLLLLLAALTLSGCIALDFGSEKVTSPQNPTIGQQLIDLKKAREAGAMGETEYQTTRERILQGK